MGNALHRQLALRLPIPVTYDIQPTLLSAIPSVLAAGAVLLMMSRKQWSVLLLVMEWLLTAQSEIDCHALTGP